MAADDRGPELRLRVRRLPHGADLPLPGRATPGAAGLDLRAALDGDLVLPPGGRAVIPTGLALELPPGWEGQVRPRSGLAAHRGVTVANAPGTIDADYRGEVRVILINLGEAEVILARGDRIAQLVVARLPRVELEEVEELGATARGDGGFGSTGGT